MTKKERVISAITHKQPDRVPKGELHIEAETANRLLKKAYSIEYENFEREVAVRNFLGMDLVNVGEWPSWKVGESKDGNSLVETVYGQISECTEKSSRIYRPALLDIEDAYTYQIPDVTKVSGEIVRRFSTETDLFVFAQIGGPVTQLDEMFTMEDFMVYSLTNTEEMNYLASQVIEYEIAKAKIFLKQGADSIVIGDDVAFNSGIFLPPYIMEKNVFPFWEKMISEIKKVKKIPVFLHSDGNVSSILPQIVSCGFDGIQSLQPSAGMDIAEIKKTYGDKLCLWGNMDLDYLMCFATPEEVKEKVKETIRIANVDGGFILSTCNTMMESIPTENILAMMEAVRD